MFQLHEQNWIISSNLHYFLFFTLTVYISGSGTCYLNDGTFSESPKEEEETVLEEITRKASIGRY